MPTISSKKSFQGLNTYSNPLSVKPGTPVIADNCVINRPGAIGNRRGFDYFTSTLTGSVLSLMEYQGGIVMQTSDSKLQYDDNLDGTFTAYSGTFGNPFGSTMRGRNSQGNFYFTTRAGVYKLSGITNPPVRAGLPAALDTRVALTGTGGGYLSGSSQVGYRVCWTRIDASKLVLRSAPSQPVFATNSTRVSVSSLTNQLSVTITRTSSTATATTSVAHNYTSGQTVTISGAAQTEYNGAFVLTVLSATTFSYTVTGTPVTPATGTIVANNIAIATTATNHGFTTGDTVSIAGAAQAAYNTNAVVTVISATIFTYRVVGSPVSPATGTITAEKALNVAVTFSVPTDIVAGDFYEIYRTRTSVSATTPAGDEMFLLTSAKFTSGTTVSYTDTSNDAFLQAALYSNANQEGIAQANYRPPFCRDVETYQNYTFFGNTQTDHSVTVTVIGLSGLIADTSFIALTRTSTATAQNYTFRTAENVGARKFQLFTAGTPAQNIDNTTRSLVRIINTDPTGLWYAQYLSGVADVPGIIQFISRTPLDGGFTVIANNGTTGANFSPALPTSGSSVISSNDPHKNRLFFRKVSAPDSVPLVNFLDFGRQDKNILRVVALRDALYVIKEDGIFYLSGLTSSQFSPLIVDLTTQCLAPDSVKKLSNQIFLLSNQGVVSIVSNEVVIVSNDISSDITNSFPFTNLSAVAFAVASEIDHTYSLFMPTGGGDTFAKVAFVFHIFQKGWTRWLRGGTAAVYLDNNRTVYLGSSVENRLLYLRNSGSQQDYSDESVAVTITAVTGSNVTLTYSSPVAPASMGMTIHQASTFAKTIAMVTNSSTSFTFTIDRNVTFATGAATVRIPIASYVLLAPDHLGESGTSKIFQDATFFTEANTVTSANIILGSNESGTLIDNPITRTIALGFGDDVFGATVFGGNSPAVQNVPWRQSFPFGANSGELATIGWKHSVAEEGFVLVYCDVTFEPGSEVTAVG